MTADHAGGARVMRRKADRDLPGAEAGDTALDQFRLIGSMHAVTAFADAAFLRAVDMQIMQVGVAVAKIGQFGGAVVDKGFGGVTGKTQVVVAQLEAGVELFWIITVEQRTVGRGVGIMADPALTGLHRPMAISDIMTDLIVAAHAKPLFR